MQQNKYKTIVNHNITTRPTSNAILRIPRKEMALVKKVSGLSELRFITPFPLNLERKLANALIRH